jgi:hypothetical protein
VAAGYVFITLITMSTSLSTRSYQSNQSRTNQGLIVLLDLYDSITRISISYGNQTGLLIISSIPSQSKPYQVLDCVEIAGAAEP